MRVLWRRPFHDYACRGPGVRGWWHGSDPRSDTLEALAFDQVRWSFL